MRRAEVSWCLSVAQSTHKSCSVVFLCNISVSVERTKKISPSDGAVHVAGFRSIMSGSQGGSTNILWQ